jgi:hypothetical protein
LILQRLQTSGLWFQNYKTHAWPQDAKAEIVEASAGSSLVLLHQNVILYDINVHELLVTAYRYIEKSNLFHPLVAFLRHKKA